MVLGGKSEILDLGRSKPLPHQSTSGSRSAHRDKHCTTQGCDWPAALCHVHHNVPWSRAARPPSTTARLLCPRHHSYAHSPKYEMKTIPNGRVVFSRT